MFKKILFPFLSLFLGFKSYDVLKLIYQLSPTKVSLGTAILIGIVLNLFVTGIIAFVGFAYKTNILLPSSYYRITNPTALAIAYKYLKVEWFKKGILFLFWGKKHNKKRYFNGTQSGLENFDFQTRQSEFGHLIAFIIIQLIVIIIFLEGHLKIAVSSGVVNIIFNFYPIVLQRKHRISIQRLYTKQKKAKLS